MKQGLKQFLLMLQFFSRLPLPWQLTVTEEDFHQGILFLPLVGLLLGAVNALAYWLGAMLGGRELAALAAIVSNLWLTGAFHLDGLADTCDGIYSSRKRERMLEIMKDSRVGTNGACAIVLDFLLRWVGLSLLTETMAPLVLLLMPVAARSCNPLLMQSVYARREGLGNLFIGKVSWPRTLASVLIGGGIVYGITGHWLVLAGFALVVLFQFLFRQYITGILGGMTGDTLGAGDECSELLLLVLSGIASWHGWL
jgi:adenosylcobinamide-GDP ribazoletransferase